VTVATGSGAGSGATAGVGATGAASDLRRARRAGLAGL